MRPGITVVGGKLQGIEALYLAKKAGLEATLIDENPNAPGKNLCDHFFCTSIGKKNDALIALLHDADFILPALENNAVLSVLADLAVANGLNIGFDWHAYGITSSKVLSNKLMAGYGIPMPAALKASKPPYIAKPSDGSGSRDILFLPDEHAYARFKRKTPDAANWIVQAFCPGRQYSIEVIGTPGNYRTYEMTELFMDTAYDCKRVTAPCGSPALAAQFAQIAVRLAEAVALKGIMDVEAIDDNGTLRVLEIDARLPSQTPTVVYNTTGVNLLTELMNVFCADKIDSAPFEAKRYTAYEHLHVSGGEIKAVGEHIMGRCAPLAYIPGFCKSDEALTDYKDGGGTLTATFINSAPDNSLLQQKREDVLNAISKMQRRTFAYNDASPHNE